MWCAVSIFIPQWWAKRMFLSIFYLAGVESRICNNAWFHWPKSIVDNSEAPRFLKVPFTVYLWSYLYIFCCGFGCPRAQVEAVLEHQNRSRLQLLNLSGEASPLSRQSLGALIQARPQATVKNTAPDSLFEASKVSNKTSWEGREAWPQRTSDSRASFAAWNRHLMRQINAIQIWSACRCGGSLEKGGERAPKAARIWEVIIFC